MTPMTHKNLLNRDKTRDLNQELLDDLHSLKTKGTDHLKSFLVGASEIVKARRGLQMTQKQFASLLKVSLRTLQDWEQGRRHPKGPAQSLIKIAIARPEVLREIFPI